MAIATVSA